MSLGTKREVWWPRPDSNRHSGFPEADFKSAVSTIPPRGLRGVLAQDRRTCRFFAHGPATPRTRPTGARRRTATGDYDPCPRRAHSFSAWPQTLSQSLPATVGDAAVLLVEFVRNLEHRQHQAAFGRPGDMPAARLAPDEFARRDLEAGGRTLLVHELAFQHEGLLDLDMLVVGQDRARLELASARSTRPVAGSNSSVLTSQPGKRVFCHSMSAGRDDMRMLVGNGLALRRDGIHGRSPFMVRVCASIANAAAADCPGPAGALRCNKRGSRSRAGALTIVQLDLRLLDDGGEFPGLGVDEGLDTPAQSSAAARCPGRSAFRRSSAVPSAFTTISLSRSPPARACRRWRTCRTS